MFPATFHTARIAPSHGSRSGAATTRAATSKRAPQYINPTGSNQLYIASDGQYVTSFSLSSASLAADGSTTFTIALPASGSSHYVEATESDNQSNILAYGSTYAYISPGASTALNITMGMNATRLALTSDATAGSDALAFDGSTLGAMCFAPNVTPNLYAFAADPSAGYVLPGTAAGSASNGGTATIPTPSLVSAVSDKSGTSRLAATPGGYKPIFDGADDDIIATFAISNPYSNAYQTYQVRIGTGSSNACIPGYTQLAASGGAGQIVVGPDHLLYTTIGNTVATIDPTASAPSLTTYAVPSPWTPYGYALAFSGSTLFVNLVQLATTNVAFTTFSLGTQTFSTPVQTGYTQTTFGIAAGGDGRIYEGLDDQLGGNNLIQPIEANGTLDASIVVGSGGTNGTQAPYHLITGQDGNIYFPFISPNGFGKVTTSGTLTVLNSSLSGRAYGPALASDGSIWFGEEGPTNPAYIGRLTTSGTLTEYPVPVKPGGIYAVTFGPDGYVWFVGNFGIFGRMSTTGVVTNIWTLPNGADPEALVTGPDKNIWVTDVTSNQVVRVVSPY